MINKKVDKLKKIYLTKLDDLNSELNNIDKDKYQNIEKYNNKISELNKQIERFME